MKNAVIGFCSIIILLLAGMAISTAEGRTMRQNELDSTLGAAMVQSMEILTMSQDYEMEDQKEFVSDVIQNALVRMNSDSEYDVEVYSVDTEKGILDAEVTETYTQLFVPGKVTARKTVVLDDYTNEDDVYYSVTFQKDGNVVKQIQVHGGDFLSGTLLPQGTGVTKWKDKDSGTVYTASNIATLAVTKNLTLEAVS